MSGTARKLTEEKVLSIMGMINEGLKQRYIALVMDVKQPTVSQIKNRKIWKHLKF